jgi:hypothetical protein
VHDEVRRVLDGIQQDLYFAGTHRPGAFSSKAKGQGSLSIANFFKFFGKLFGLQRDEITSKKWRSKRISFDTAR